MYEGFYDSIERVIATKTGIAVGNIEVTDNGTWYVPVGLPDGFVFRSESQIAEGYWRIDDGAVFITQELIEPESEPAPASDPQMDEWLMVMVTVAARHALAYGTDREDIAQVLESLAAGIRNPPSVAENMGPLTMDMIDVTGPFMFYTE